MFLGDVGRPPRQRLPPRQPGHLSRGVNGRPRFQFDLARQRVSQAPKGSCLMWHMGLGRLACAWGLPPSTANHSLGTLVQRAVPPPCRCISAAMPSRSAANRYTARPHPPWPRRGCPHSAPADFATFNLHRGGNWAQALPRPHRPGLRQQQPFWPSATQGSPYRRACNSASGSLNLWSCTGSSRRPSSSPSS